jgi:hypothetical protein
MGLASSPKGLVILLTSADPVQRRPGCEKCWRKDGALRGCETGRAALPSFWDMSRRPWEVDVRQPRRGIALNQVGQSGRCRKLGQPKFTPRPRSGGSSRRWAPAR